MTQNLVLFASDTRLGMALRRYCFAKLLPPDHRALILLGPEHPEGRHRRFDEPPTEDEVDIHRASRYFGAWDETIGALLEGRYGRLTPERLDWLIRWRRIGLVMIEDLRCIDHETPLDAVEALAAKHPITFAVLARPATLRGRTSLQAEYRYPVDDTARVPEAGLLLDGKVALSWTDHI